MVAVNIFLILNYFFRLNVGKEEDEFTESLRNVLQSIGELMRYNTDTTLLVQGACLKYLPSTIPDIVQVFKPALLRYFLFLSSALMVLFNSTISLTLKPLIYSISFYKSI